MEAKQDVLASSRRELEEEKDLLERGQREAATEADKLDLRREVRIIFRTRVCMHFHERFIWLRRIYSELYLTIGI